MKIINKFNTILFDLYFTLVYPQYYENDKQNEYFYLGIDKNTWIKVAEELYQERAIGKIKDPVKMIENIAYSIDPNIPKEKIELATQARIKKI